MKKNWKLLSTDLSFNGAASFCQLEKSIQQILFFRGIDSEEKLQHFLSPDYEKNLGDPFLLSDMERAVQRILQALKEKEKVCVFGDYDADGVTSAALLKDFFDQLGLDNFCYIPDRNKEGYGMNLAALDYLKEQGTQLIVTVDCGISNAKEVAYARQLGLEVIIIDHHHVPEEVPAAWAVINPKKKEDHYPEKELAGVGVAFKFVQAVASLLPGYDQHQLKWLLDLVAIGTIADCVPLLGENRILAKFGLLVLSKTKRVGLQQLFQVGRINISENNLPSSQQVSFQIAPRINAAGRMDHANTAYKLLIAKPQEAAAARVLALELEEKNQHRQKVTKLIISQVEKRLKEKVELPKIIIEADPHWELGVIGLAAGKVTDQFNRPAILLQMMDSFSKGSGRSTRSFNLIEALERQKDLLDKYGGHRQAAGLTIENDRLEEFKKRFTQEAAQLSVEDLVKQIVIDAQVKFENINEKLLQELRFFEPFGQENWQPVFLSRQVRVVERRIIGNGEKHLKLWLQDDQDPNKRIFEALGFGLAEECSQLKTGDQVDVVYHLEKDSWNGQEKVQLKIIDLQSHD